MKKVGLDAKLYISDTLLDGDTNTPDTLTWDEVKPVKDVTLNLETEEADTTTRATNGWQTGQATLKNGSIEFEMRVDHDDDGYKAIRDAWKNRGFVAAAAMSGEIDEEGEEGLVANMSVTNFTRNEPLNGDMTVNITLRPAEHVDWYEVPGE